MAYLRRSVVLYLHIFSLQETSYSKRSLSDPPLLTKIFVVSSHVARTTLTQNSRSHEYLVTMPSNVFNGGDLVASRNGDPSQDLAPMMAQVITRARFGTFADKITRDGKKQAFFNVRCPAAVEPNGTCSYNPGGITAILKFVDMLLAAGIAPRRIGIITLLRTRLRNMRFNNSAIGYALETATVDAFQG